MGDDDGLIPPSDFNQARADVLEAFSVEFNYTLLDVLRLYRTYPVFAERIDATALSLLQPQSETLH
jgi:hypothetical protein